MLKPAYTWTIAGIMMILIFMLVIGCETQNPVCSENYCVIGAIFPRSEIGDYPTVTKKPRTNYGYAPEGGLSFYEKTAHGCYFEKG